MSSGARCEEALLGTALGGHCHVHSHLLLRKEESQVLEKGGLLPETPEHWGQFEHLRFQMGRGVFASLNGF